MEPVGQGSGPKKADESHESDEAVDSTTGSAVVETKTGGQRLAPVRH